MMTFLAFNFHRDTLSDDLDHKLSHDTPTVRAGVTAAADLGRDESGVADVEPSMMKLCKSCQESGPDDAEFCSTCGEALIAIRRVPDMYLDEVVGKYRIVEKVGQGGMGVVYLGRNDELGQKVAVKFLSKKFAQDKNLVLRFFNEAKSYCRVNHPNAVTLLDYGQHDDGALYIITEFVEGDNVTETLQARGARGPLPADVVLDLGIQMAEVLSAAHSQGVIHRDLKPDNIMLMPLSRGRYAVKVLDFGIAKIVDEEDGPNTETGSVFGTPEFMSPEQARGDEADGRSDIYALGVILFYMVTGKLPFRGKNKLVVLNMQLNDPPPRPRDLMPSTDISARFESVIMKCLNKGPAQRYDNADDLLEALEDVRVPGGHATGKIGARREFATTPLMRQSDAESDLDWDEIHTHDETLASIESRRPGWDVESIEMDREQHDTGRAPKEASPSIVPAAIMIVAVLAVGALLYTAFDSSAPVAVPDPISTQTMDRVDSSHRDAVLETVQRLLEVGNLEGARSAFDYSPVTDSEARRELNRQITELERQVREFDRQLADSQCDGARATANDLEIAAIRTELEQRLGACRAAHVRADDEPRVPDIAPTPSPSITTPAPEPVKVIPDPPAIAEEEDSDSGERAEEEEELPDDMALPPKTLD